MKSTIQASLVLLFFSSFFLSACRKAVLIDPSLGGKKWVRVFDDYAVDIFFIDPNNGIILSKNKLYKTTDGGDNWTTIDGLFEGYNIGMGSITNFCVVGERIALVTNDGGSTFKFFSGDIFSDCFYLNATTCVINAKRKIVIARDGGKNFESVFNQDSLSLEDPYVPFKSSTSLNENYFWIAKSSGKIYETKNQGSSWRSVVDRKQYIYSVQLITDKLSFMSDKSGIHRSLDGGVTWVGIGSDAKDFHFFDEQRGYKSSEGNVLFTKDGGTSWTTVFEINGQVGEMLFLNENTGWVSTSIGVFKLVQ